MIYNELKTGFRWYDALDKQNRFKDYCENACTYALISPCNDLLPFQIRTNGFGTITSWKLIYLDGTFEMPETTPGVDPSVAWNIGHTSGAGSVEIQSSTTNLAYGCVNYATSLDYTMAQLVISINTKTNLGTRITARPFNTVQDFTASWDVPTQTLTLNSPVGSGTTYNSMIVQFAVAGGFWSLEAGNNKTFSGGTNEVTVYVESTELDITDCSNEINTYTIGTNTYLQYNGIALSGCMSMQMPCGKWYSEISDGTKTLYSEVYDVQQFEDLEFTQSILPLFTPWRFYDSIDKQNRFKEYCPSDCNIFNLSTNDKLLPFQIRANNGTIGIQSWKLINLNGDCEIILDTTLVQIVSTSDGDRIIYDGSAISGLPCGDYYVVIDDGITYWYSELIKIINETDTDQYLMTDDGVQLTNDDGQYLTID